MQDHPKSVINNVEADHQAEQLLEIIAQLARELHPHRRPLPLSLDDSLDREYGFDSLSRVELLLRLERAFD
ncbi:MAG: hypothetical protein GQ470_03130, partial [Gammaproteobacteria bacterium]|nr:hypothetical protein [Gammaproteobacteria bacterium]